MFTGISHTNAVVTLFLSKIKPTHLIRARHQSVDAYAIINVYTTYNAYQNK